MRITVPLTLVSVLLSGCVATPQKLTSLNASTEGAFSFPGVDNYWKGKTSDLSGELDFPAEASSSTFPAVVILHGSAGPGYRSDDWARFLNAEGYATFKLDYYTHRGLRRGGRDGPASAGDVYSALAILSTHPKIDKSKIAVMGFSRGGSITLLSTAYRPAYTGGIDPAAFIAFYPGCERIRIDYDTPDAPIAVLLGDKDSLTSKPACEALAEGAGEYRKDVRLYVYEGGYHGFDDNEARTVQWGGTTVRMQPDAVLKARAREDVSELLAEVFGG